MNDVAIETLGDQLFAAIRDRNVVEPPTSLYPGITIDHAYRVSNRILTRRIENGELLVGRKIGLTNERVQEYFRIDHPDFGNLTDAMQFRDGDDIDISALLIQPKIEGEIAFVLNRDLRGPGVTANDVLAATEYVTPCFEIVDSRVRDWRIKIEDTVADNGSSGLFVMGDDQVDPGKLDLSACEMTMTSDGKIVSEGSGAAALGSPLNCVAWLANAIGIYGDALRSGDIILSGSLGPVVPAVPDTDMTVSISGMGDASVHLS